MTTLQVGCLLAVILIIVQCCNAINDVDCDFDLKVLPGQPIQLSNYGGKGNRHLTSCRWRIFSDTKVKLTCRRRAYLNPEMANCHFNFLIYPDGTGLSQPYKNCGENYWYKSNKNVMVVTLDGPANIPDYTFDCQFEATEECSCGWKNPSKIIHGDETNINEYPMVAGIIAKSNGISFPIRKGDIFCGATIISSQYVMTAAHCLISRINSQLGVIIGDHQLEKHDDTTASLLYGIEYKEVHQYYNYDYSPSSRKYVYKQTNHNDIGLIKLKGFIEYTNAIGPACLPFNRLNIAPGEKVSMFGWGINEDGSNSASLQKATVKVVSEQECKKHNPSINPTQMCTHDQRQDACQNDSGGPVLWRDPSSTGLFLVGVISNGKGCGDKVIPSYNTRVSSFLDWIVRYTPDTSYCKVQ